MGISSKRGLILAALALAFGFGRAGASTYTVLHNFQILPRNPFNNLVSDGSGNLYGTSTGDFLFEGGTIFKLKADGTGLSVLHWFPQGAPAVVLGQDGVLYGVCIGCGLGSVFRLNSDGTGYTTLHDFAGGTTDGDTPYGGLAVDSGGNLYGTTFGGGSHDAGILFTIKSNGTGYSVLHSFGSFAGDGLYSYASLVLDGAGSLYGTTQQGGTNGLGTVFTIRSDGTSYSVLHSFSGKVDDGAYPLAALVSDSLGNLYGTTSGGGSADLGSAFAMTTSGTGFALLHSFSGATDGSHPYDSLLLDSSGSLSGTTSDGGGSDLGVVFSIKTDGTLFSILHTFSGNITDGSTPYAGLIADSSGKLYGTSYDGGYKGYGSIYSLNKDGGGFSVLNSFYDRATDGDEGTSCSPALDDSGILFGTAGLGGAGGGGVVSRLTTGGTSYEVLHSFEFSTPGVNPGITLDGSGKVYGTTIGGGSGGWGTVFSMRTDGLSFAVLHSFASGAGDGATPLSPLVLDGAGYLYGVTNRGGASNKGIIFRIKTNGTGFSTLHSFSGGQNDGDSPFASMTFDGVGNLYGTTGFGGSSNEGTVFTIKTDGTGFTLLYSAFQGGFPNGLVLDGSGNLFGNTTRGQVFKLRIDGTAFSVLGSVGEVSGSLILDGNGNLYGTTLNGGPGNAGTVFTIRADGTGFALLHTCFGDTSEGKHPFSGLRLDGAGNLYGAMTSGGALGGGVLFKLSGATGGGSTLGTPVISAPVESQSFTESRINLAWGSVAGAAGYDLRVLDDSRGSTVYSGNFAGFSSTATPVDLPNGGFSFRVRACAGGFSDTNCGLFATVDFTVNVLPPTTSTTKFYTLTPCRIADTRNAPGPYGGPALSAGLSRVFKLTGQCGIPTGATAASVNITVVTPTDPGALKLNPTGADPQVATAISFPAGRVLANNAMVFLGSDGAMSVFDAQDTGSTHFIIDVNGYFR